MEFFDVVIPVFRFVVETYAVTLSTLPGLWLDWSHR